MERRFASIALAGLLSVACAQMVHAQPFHVPVYTGTPLMISIGTVTQQTLNRQISTLDRREKSTNSSRTSRSVSDVRTSLAVGSAPAGMPARMAAHAPEAARFEVERVYRQMLDQHPQLMRQLGVPANDVASAVATFLAGSYIAYHGVDFPDRQFKPLYEQVRQIIGTDASFARATEAQRREMYEETAILGTYLALTREGLKQRPDAQLAAAVKAAAKDYLQQFLKVDPERLQLTDRGLVVN